MAYTRGKKIDWKKVDYGFHPLTFPSDPKGLASNTSSREQDSQPRTVGLHATPGSPTMRKAALKFKVQAAKYFRFLVANQLFCQISQGSRNQSMPSGQEPADSFCETLERNIAATALHSTQRERRAALRMPEMFWAPFHYPLLSQSPSWTPVSYTVYKGHAGESSGPTLTPLQEKYAFNVNEVQVRGWIWPCQHW